MFEYKGRLMNDRVNVFYFPGLLSALSITASMFLDIAIVGQMLGPIAMGAVSLALPLTMVFNMVYMLLGIGGEVLVSAAKGAGNKTEANKLFSLTMFTIITVSILFTLIGLGASDRVATVLSGGESEMKPLLAQYIHIIFITAPLMIGVTSMTYFVKVDALPKLAAGIMVFVNIVGTISKVLYLGPLQLGIAGAAYGTMTGFVAGFLLLSPYLVFRKNRTLCFVPLAVKDLLRLGHIIVAGLPSALGQGLGAVVTFCINVVIMDLAGKSGIIVNTVCASLSIFLSSFRYAATSAMVPIVGALFGERDWWSMHQVAMRITKIVMGFVAVCTLLIEFFPSSILSFFGVHDGNIIAMGVPALRIYALGLLIGSFTYILMTYMQTTARKAFSIAISAGSEIFAVLFIYLLGYGVGNQAVWAYMLAANLLLLLFIIVTAKYIGKRSNGQYHGIFIHEVQPGFVLGNSIYATAEAATGYNELFGQFLAEQEVPESTIEAAKQLLFERLMMIVDKEKNARKTIDIMAFVYDGVIKVRLRDDSKAVAAEVAEADDRVSQLSVMGYHNTYIEIPVN
ncbi:MAG: MATE family efflux transporter [Sporomusaceae bacterium]|nr:MATE family efflux transporter [Sporomusaceae bacterium]